MTAKLKQDLNQVLDMIGYTQDRQGFADRYFDLCAQQAVFYLIDAMNDADRQQALHELGNLLRLRHYQRAADWIKHRFSRAEFDRAMEEVMVKDMNGMVDSVVATLPADQQPELKQALRQWVDSRTNTAPVVTS